MTEHAIVDDYGEELAVLEVDEDAEYVLAVDIANLIDMYAAMKAGELTAFTVYPNSDFSAYSQSGKYWRGNLHTIGDNAE